MNLILLFSYYKHLLFVLVLLLFYMMSAHAQCGGRGDASEARDITAAPLPSSGIESLQTSSAE